MSANLRDLSKSHKDTGLLMTDGNVRAILEDRKTQTRRVVKPQPVLDGLEPFGESWKWQKGKDWFSGVTREQLIGEAGLLYGLRCPYGSVGDRLWFRETYGINPDLPVSMLTDGKPVARRHIRYRATDAKFPRGRWRPSIFMHRWACRLEGELTAVRVERVQDITEADSIAEGVKKVGAYWHGAGIARPTAREAFQDLWDSINAARGYGWESNPFVWVLAFKRLESEVRA